MNKDNFPYYNLKDGYTKNPEWNAFPNLGGPLDPRAVIKQFDSIGSLSGSEVFAGLTAYFKDDREFKLCVWTPKDSNPDIMTQNFTGADCIWKDIYFGNVNHTSEWVQVGENWSPTEVDPDIAKAEEIMKNMWKRSVNYNKVYWGFFNVNLGSDYEWNVSSESTPNSPSSEDGGYIVNSDDLGRILQSKFSKIFSEDTLKEFAEQTIYSPKKGTKARFSDEYLTEDDGVYYGSFVKSTISPSSGTKKILDFEEVYEEYEPEYDKLVGCRFVALVPSDYTTNISYEDEIAMKTTYAYKYGTVSINENNFDVYVSYNPIYKRGSKVIPNTYIQFTDFKPKS